MKFVNSTIEEFKDFFQRDFPFGSNINENILDTDIQKAFDVSVCIINPNLFEKQNCYTLAFLWLSAHNLTVSLNNSSQGLSSSFSWPQNSRSVGSVSESLSLPASITENPIYSEFTTTAYGGRYLVLIWPYLKGQIFTVYGSTHA